jgi:hypothetical protein
MTESPAISSKSSLSDLFDDLKRAQEESQALVISSTKKMLELLQPAVVQLNDCYVQQNRLNQIILVEDTSDEDKIKIIRRAILKLKAENSKLNLSEQIMQDEFLKDETNKQIFNKSVLTLHEKLIECNNLFTNIGGVIADESLTNAVKLENIENILVAL